MPRPFLPDVTLCCIDCLRPDLALRALRLSRAQCDFAETLLLTDAPLRADGIEVRPIPRIATAEDYSDFVLKRLLAHLRTPFVLLVQWDGYVLDGARWEEGFRAFDYIGAPWPWQTDGMQVGNGGFSLRSRRLLAMLAEPGFVPDHPEDDMICREWRQELEHRGIAFADPQTARRFAVERDQDPAPSFGFHGLFNFWRTVPAAELPGLLASLPPAALVPRHGRQLMMAYATRARPAEAVVVLRRLEEVQGAAALDADLAGLRHTDGRPLDVPGLRRWLMSAAGTG